MEHILGRQKSGKVHCFAGRQQGLGEHILVHAPYDGGREVHTRPFKRGGGDYLKRQADRLWPIGPLTKRSRTTECKHTTTPRTWGVMRAG